MRRVRRNVEVTVLVTIVCLLVFPPAFAQDNLNKIVKESIVSNKKKRSYYLFVPSSIKSPAPLIVLLHGSGRDGNSLVEKWKDLAAKEGFIIAGPDAESGGGWSAPRDGPDFLHELVEELKSKYSIDPQRVYLFGHSAGAVFALMMAMAESEYFAATAIHAGAFRDPDEYKVIASATRKIPLAIWVGTNDAFFPLSDVRATRDAFRTKGFTIEVTEMPGHTHWYYDVAGSINQGAWEFLKKYELASEPRYSRYTPPGPAGSANKLIEESNALAAKAQQLIQQSNQKEQEIAGKDFARDRAEINQLAQTEVDILTEAAGLWRSAAEKAQSARELKLPGKQEQYFSLIAKYDLKCAEFLDAMRESAEALLSVDALTAIQAKRDALQKRAEALHLEIDELQKAIDRVLR
jgi:poly(3-hydroxybutyrate) depolymerase